MKCLFSLVSLINIICKYRKIFKYFRAENYLTFIIHFIIKSKFRILLAWLAWGQIKGQTSHMNMCHSPEVKITGLVR